MLDADQVNDKGEVGALNQAFEVIFGFESRSKGDGIIPLKEHGPSIYAIVEVLRKYTTKYLSDAILQKWVDDLLKSGENR